MLLVLDSSISSTLFSLYSHLLLIQCYCKRKSKLTLFILDSSISSKLFFLEVQLGSSLIVPVLLEEET
jgi:hypothetical protein